MSKNLLEDLNDSRFGYQLRGILETYQVECDKNATKEE